MLNSILGFFAALFGAAKVFFQFRNRRSIEKGVENRVEVDARKEAREKINELHDALDDDFDTGVFDTPENGPSERSE